MWNSLLLCIQIYDFHKKIVGTQKVETLAKIFTNLKVVRITEITFFLRHYALQSNDVLNSETESMKWNVLIKKIQENHWQLVYENVSLL